ncbi:transglycosylase SLT domain-containing protein [Marinobacterium sp. YM272]|uniref:transglycosylase SLT domain-containing protein n=1 Tax=Marinobacterium sp. YM272 TaxID=3421654 RepID=UPI003D7FB596
MLASCASSPPSNVENACRIFREKPDWFDASLDAEQKYGLPIQVQLAIMRQESSFRHDAAPPRDTFLGIPMWWRVSSAYGYAQVKDGTWDWYKDKTGNWGADRDDYDDAVDFMGWYADLSQRTLGISKWDAYNQYLAYHEGHGGWKRKTYNRKGWLVRVARNVDANARMYGEQLRGCRDSLGSSPWWWPF